MRSKPDGVVSDIVFLGAHCRFATSPRLKITTSVFIESRVGSYVVSCGIYIHASEEVKLKRLFDVDSFLPLPSSDQSTSLFLFAETYYLRLQVLCVSRFYR